MAASLLSAEPLVLANLLEHLRRTFAIYSVANRRARSHAVHPAFASSGRREIEQVASTSGSADNRLAAISGNRAFWRRRLGSCRPAARRRE